MVEESGGEEAHAQDQEQVGENAAQKGSLDQAKLVFGQRNDCDNQLHCISEPERSCQLLVHDEWRIGTTHVALSRPPSVWPIFMESCSVASPRSWVASQRTDNAGRGQVHGGRALPRLTLARGIMARKDVVKRQTAGHSACSAYKQRGTAMRRAFIHDPKRRYLDDSMKRILSALGAPLAPSKGDDSWGGMASRFERYE